MMLDLDTWGAICFASNDQVDISWSSECWWSCYDHARSAHLT